MIPHPCGKEAQPFVLTVLKEPVCVQDNAIADLPRLIERSSAALGKAEARLKALKGLQPEWTQLRRLQTDVIPSTEARLRELEVEVAGRASATADLHEQKTSMDATQQVCSCCMFYIKEVSDAQWLHVADKVAEFRAYTLVKWKV